MAITRIIIKSQFGQNNVLGKKCPKRPTENGKPKTEDSEPKTSVKRAVDGRRFRAGPAVGNLPAD
jgi:hypothetical protein